MRLQSGRSSADTQSTVRHRLRHVVKFWLCWFVTGARTLRVRNADASSKRRCSRRAGVCHKAVSLADDFFQAGITRAYLPLEASARAGIHVPESAHTTGKTHLRRNTRAQDIYPATPPSAFAHELSCITFKRRSRGNVDGQHYRSVTTSTWVERCNRRRARWRFCSSRAGQQRKKDEPPPPPST